MPMTPMSSTCLAIQLFISMPLGGTRTIGVTAGASVPPLDDLAAVEHELQRVAQSGEIERRMFHLECDAVELRAGHGDGTLDIYRRECDEGGLALFEGFDYAV